MLFFLNQSAVSKMNSKETKESGKTSLNASHDIPLECFILLVYVVMASPVCFAEMQHLWEEERRGQDGGHIRVCLQFMSKDLPLLLCGYKQLSLLQETGGESIQQ